MVTFGKKDSIFIALSDSLATTEGGMQQNDGTVSLVSSMQQEHSHSGKSPKPLPSTISTKKELRQKMRNISITK